MIPRRSFLGLAAAFAALGGRMIDPTSPDSLAARFAEMERRLAALERSPQLTNSSIKGGSVRILNAGGDAIAVVGDTDVGQGVAVYDGAGVVVARLGSLDGTVPGGRQGIQIGANPNSSANDWLDVSRENGISFPFLGHAWHDPSSYKVVTSGSFTTVWQCQVELVASTDVLFTVDYSADAATTGELRIVAATATSSTKTIAAAAFGTGRVEWRHGLALGGGPIGFEVQARRTSGVGNINVYQPTGLHTGRTSGATTGGLA